ncbi:MAG: hypothetical protein A4E57_04044 [Syntrophorhabdaceae bacterium PtaU1.Bin034]|nr:MAG: hypothetical protein A4E57_04044 [Syntrophorhabdaceae bacterium PtaU1.Bin034]
MLPLEEKLRKRIAQEGPVTYEAVLESALYDENDGYYRNGKQERQDYYTSPEIHPIFGRTIGGYVENVSRTLKIPSVSIVELGGASGGLAGDIISAFRHLTIDRYLIIEKGQERRNGQVEWVNSVDRIGRMDGFTFIVANEFFDALPFHRVIMQKGVLHEIYTGYQDGFIEQAGPLSGPVASFLERHPVFLQENQVTEVTTYSVPLLEKLSELVERACLLVFDYGYHQTDISTGRFFEGSLVGYKERKIRNDLFGDLGKMDITHHVNFDHLSDLLAGLGWKKDGEIEQYRFLYKAGLLEELSRLPQTERLSAKWLINPAGLGSMISVLGFSKNLSFPLPGF